MIYGMSAKSLTEQMEVDEGQAAEYMESFKAMYSGDRLCHFILDGRCIKSVGFFVSEG